MGEIQIIEFAAVGGMIALGVIAIARAFRR